MLAILSLISLTLLGGAPTPGEPEGQVRVNVRVLEMKGISWRGDAYHQLTPQERQGAASVWTSDNAGLKILREKADQVVQFPLAVTAEGASSQVKNEIQHSYVAHLKRVADGPLGENTSVAYEPVIGTVPDGVTAEFSCRAVEGGTMVKATVDDIHLLGFDTFTFKDTVTDPKTRQKTAVGNLQIQLPNLTTSHVAGEWLVPRGGAIVVGFGAKSADKSRAGARERVVVIEPEISWTRNVIRDSMVIAGVHIPMHGFEPRPGDRVAPARDTSRQSVAPKAIAIARPVPISPTVLPLLASPTLAPRPGGTLTVRLEARTTPSTTTDADVVKMMCLPLSAAPLPIRLPNVWLSASIEPRRDEIARMQMATPPTRGLPTSITVEGEIVDLPPLPDDLVVLASSSLTGEPTPTPQTVPTAFAPPPLRPLNAHLERVLDQFLANRHAALNQIACDEVLIYPAPTIAPTLIPLSGGGCFVCKSSISKSAANSQFTGDERERDFFRSSSTIDRDGPRDPASARQAKSDLSFLRTFYGDLFSRADGTEREIEERAINTERQAATQKTVRGATLGLQLKTADGECEYDSGISLKAIEAQPVTVRIPMADGTIVEIQAKVVKAAKK